MISEVFDLLSSIDTRQSGNKRGLKLNLNRNRIRSISAYSSNSIFYFTTIVPDDATPEEIAMVSKMIERSYASFVVACISLIPFHRISADDQASVEEYLNQFHQNIGMNQGAGPALNRMFAEINMSENMSNEDLQATQNFLLETWKESLQNNTDFIKLVSESVSLNDMFNEDAIDPKTRVLQEQYLAVMKEMDTWGFVGEASDTLFDSEDDDALLNMSDEEIYQQIMNDPTLGGLSDDDDDALEDDDSVLDSDLSEASGNVKNAIDTIKFSLESVSVNKILSCSSLTKLASLEAKLNKLKSKYTKYLNRYKHQYNENKKNHSNKKLSIRFNKMVISDPKAFMQQYGTYIKLINKRLKLVEQRRAELRKRKGIEDINKADQKKLEESVTLSDMDFQAIDYCDKIITESLEAPNSEIFILTEVTDDEFDTLKKKYVETHKRYTHLKGTVSNVATNARNQSKKNAALHKENEYIRKSYRDMKTQRNDAQKEIKSMETKISRLEKENEKLKNKTSQVTQTSPAVINPSDGEDVYYGRPRGGMIPSRMRTNSIKVFDKEVFTDMDVKKANEAVPIFAKASIGFIVDETEEVVTRDVLVGIKAYIHRYSSKDMINDVYSGVINNRKFLKFVKFITGEERSLSDLIFGIKELKVDAIDSRNQASAWKTAFKRRKRWAKISIPYLMKEYTPNGTLVMTMNQVSYIKDEYGLDIMDPSNVKVVMDTNYLLGFVIIDQAEEIVYVTYDGHGYGFQQYTYAMLERENNTLSNREVRELYRSLSR